MFARIGFVLLVWISLCCTGCQWMGASHPIAQPYGGVTVPPPVNQVPVAYRQTVPMNAPIATRPNFGAQAVRYAGSLANGFLRSAANSAGWTAGRDVWREIAN